MKYAKNYVSLTEALVYNYIIYKNAFAWQEGE